MTDETIETETPKPGVEEPAVKRRLTPREYARAKTMWQSGEYSLGEISEEVDVSAPALSKRFKRDSIVRGSNTNKVSAAVQRAIERTSAAQADELAATAHDLKMQALKALELFNKKAFADVATAIKDKTKLGDRLNDLKALETASKIISTNYGTGARILGLDKDINPDDQMPELHIKLMTENDVAELREQQIRDEAEANGDFEDDPDLMAELSDEDLEEIDRHIEDGEGDVELEA